MHILNYESFEAYIITLVLNQLIFNVNRYVTDNKKLMVSLPIKYKIINTDYLLFINKISSNLCLDHDNNIGGK